MLGLVPSATVLGVDGHAVTVEVHVSTGLPSFTVVGLPDAACREASGRVRAALLSSRCQWPMQRVTVNLAPPTIRKVGSGLDLPIAIALLVAVGAITQDAVGDRSFVGELGLDGSVRPVPGTVCLVDALGPGPLVLPAAGAAEATLVGDRVVHPVRSLQQVIACLRGEDPWPGLDPPSATPEPRRGPDLSDVRGQPVARYALELAAAGGHHLLLNGPPGAGKTMLAARLPGLLPPLADHEAVQTTRIHSAAGLPLPVGSLVRTPPFRAPHHGASAVALVGGGSGALRPGEIERGAQRRAVPRRAGRVPRPCRQRAPAAAGGRRGARGPGRRVGHHPRPVPAGRRHEPVPVRRGRRARVVPVHGGPAAAVPTPALGAAARPLRLARRGPPAQRRRSPRPRAG